MMERYQKIKKIGEGSFGKAYLVKSRANGQQYVIKEINIVRMSKKEREEARKEVALLAQMNHPNIVTYRESFEETGSLYICMDFCDGGDMYSKINAQRGILFTEDQVIDWFIQICFSIKYIHDRKILHRDIKSQNIFLTKNGSIKLGDFGIAKVLNSTVELARTCIGTPYYLSPEICENRPYNNKSDIWSLGCVLYEMTTLKHAFEAGNMKNLVFKIVRGSYPPVSAKYSYDLRNVIAQLFKRNPRDRPSINNLLRKNFLLKRVERFMGNDVIAKELAHTVMHGQKMAKDIRALPPAPAHPPSARRVPEKKPEVPKPTPRYDPASVYGVPSARKSRESAPRRSRESSRKSADAEKKRVANAAAAVVAANNDLIARRRKELLEKEKKRREAQNDKQFAVQHKAIMDKQKVARMKKAREEGWKGLMESISSNEDEKSSSEGRPKTPQQPVKKPVPAPKPVGGVPQRMPGDDRGRYDHYHEYFDKLQQERNPDRPKAPSPAEYMQMHPAPQVAAVQANQDRHLGARAAERARVVEEFMNRKREAAYYKARGQAQVGGGAAKRPESARSGAGDGRVKRQWEEIDAKNAEEKEYLERLKHIRLQNFNDRRNINKVAAGGNKPGIGVKGAMNAPDADAIRRKKIEALKAQADDRARRLKEQLEQKRREAYEKEKQALQNRDREQKPLFPVMPPKKVEPAPVISITQVMAAIGASKGGEKVEPAPVNSITQVMAAIGARKEVDTSVEKSPLQKKKDEILRRVNEKPRSKWGARDENVPALANMELEETASNMDVTSVRDSVVRLGEDGKPKEERSKRGGQDENTAPSARKQWGEPKPEAPPSARRLWGDPDTEAAPSSRKHWGGFHDSIINKLSEAEIQATVTLPKKDQAVPGVGETIVITKQPPTPKAHGTITISKDATTEEEEEESSESLDEDSGPKAKGSTITISAKGARTRRRSRSKSPTPKPLPELKPDEKPKAPNVELPEQDSARTRERPTSMSPTPRPLPEMKPDEKPQAPDVGMPEHVSVGHRGRSVSPTARPLPELKREEKSEGAGEEANIESLDLSKAEPKKRSKTPLSFLKAKKSAKSESPPVVEQVTNEVVGTEEEIAHLEVSRSKDDDENTELSQHSAEEQSESTSDQEVSGTEIIAQPEISTPNVGTEVRAQPEITTPNAGTEVRAQPEVSTPNAGTEVRAQPEISTPNAGTEVRAQPEISTPNAGTEVRDQPEISTPNAGTEVRARPEISTPNAGTEVRTQPESSTPNAETEVQAPEETSTLDGEERQLATGTDAPIPQVTEKREVNARTVHLELMKESEMDQKMDEREVNDGPSSGVPEPKDSTSVESVTDADVAPVSPAEHLQPKGAWEDEKPTTPEPSPEQTTSTPKPPPTVQVESAPTEVNQSEGGKLFDKVALEEDDDKPSDDMKVEEYVEEQDEKNASYHETITGMKLGLTIGHYDLKDSKMLRTCSLPDLFNLFKTEESPEVHVRYSLDLPSPRQAREEERKLGASQEEDSDEVGDEEDEDLASVMETMESILLDRQDSKVEKDLQELDDLRGSVSNSSDEGETEGDSATTTGDSSVLLGNEEWCSDDDDDDDPHDDEDDMFCRLEESRAQLESELGCDRFLEVYKAVQAAHEDEDETIENGEKIALKILGEHGHLYNKILQLVLADGAYIEDNN